ncbi:hypothetical protein PIROE2DRAFT_14323 [Piromyces sp. E2]|nr:hypothetical protein PIROE2DRAFT_14323 [Piromyces sp. E2]|eukprot:OUM60029.1 hypothetical protein PIROE2DRAFT_14323 [Piromyces sp. E2]
MAYVSNDPDNHSVAYFKNIRQFNTGIVKGLILEGGLIMGLQYGANVDVDNYYAENLINNDRNGSAFNIYHLSTLVLNNIVIKKIRSNAIDSLFVNTMEGSEIYLKATNITLDDAYQISQVRSGVLLWFNENSKADIKKLMFTKDNCPLNIENLEVYNFYSVTYQELFIFETNTPNNGK